MSRLTSKFILKPKNVLYLFIGLLSVVSVFYACKKEIAREKPIDQTFFEHTTKNDLINWAVQNLKEQNLRSNFAHNIYLKYGQPEWDYSDAFYAYEGMPTIVTPFTDRNKKEITSIWIIVYDKGQIKSQIISEKELTLTQYNNSSNKMIGDFSQMFRYLRGKVFNQGSNILNKPDKLASTQPLKQDKISYYTYVETCVDWWQYASVNGQVIPGSFQYTNTTCKTEMIWIPEITPNSTTPLGTSSSPPAGYGNLTPTSFAKIIMNPANRECLKNITTDITKYATISHHLQRVFAGVTGYNNVNSMIDRLANSSSWNVEVKEGTTVPRINDNGDTVKDNAVTLASGGKVTITVDKGYLNTATDLAIARTIIHELLHTYFEYGKTQTNDPGYSEFVAVNNLLYNKDGGILPEVALAQHNLIASSYVNQLGYLLYAYAESKGINSPDPNMTLLDYCRDLAWGGLHESKAYGFLKNKTRVEKNIMNEQNNANTSSKIKSCSK